MRGIAVRRTGNILLLSLLASVPFLGLGSYWTELALLTYLYMAMSLAWNLLGGLAGQISFGFSAFFGLGAYATAIFYQQGVTPYVGILIGGGVAVLASVLIGYPTFRLRGPYYSIATVGVAEAIGLLMLNWQSVSGGAAGITLPPTAKSEAVYYLSLALAAGAMWVTWRIRGSKFGLGLLAINAQTDAAEAIGVDATAAKLKVQALAAFIVGIAGGIYVWDTLFVEPRMAFSLQTSISLMLMPVIGGVGTLAGPILGALVFNVVQQLLLASIPNLHLLFYGGLLIVFTVLEPKGLVGLWSRVRGRIMGVAA